MAFRTHSTDFSQHVTYGITDDISVRFTLGYAWSKRRLDPTFSSEYFYQWQGFNDPSFETTWRVIDQRRHPFSLDLNASYSPDVFPNKAATTTHEGTLARGGQAASLGVAVGRETRTLTIRGVLSDAWQDDSEVEQPFGGLLTTGFWTPSIAIETQTRFTPRLSLNIDGEYDFPGDSRIYNQFFATSAGGGTQLVTPPQPSYVSQRGNYQIIRASLNYHFIANRLVGSVVYAHTFYDRSENIFPPGGFFIHHPSYYTVLTRSTDAVDVILRYVFR